MAANHRTSLSAGIVVRAILLEDEGVTSITRRIFPVVADNAQLPYIFYRRSALEADPTKGGMADAVQIELCCCAEDYDGSLELAEAVRGALDGAQGTAGDLRMRGCYLADSEETWQDDAYIQQLVFNVKIS